MGNTDSGTQVTNSFPEAVRANVIEIEPVEVERAFCIRFELLGCRGTLSDLSFVEYSRQFLNSLKMITTVVLY